MGSIYQSGKPGTTFEQDVWIDSSTGITVIVMWSRDFNKFSIIYF